MTQGFESQPLTGGLLLGFGGLGMPMNGHTWQAEKNWGYVSGILRNKLEAGLKPRTSTKPIGDYAYNEAAHQD
jgi:hypothetical protein